MDAPLIVRPASLSDFLNCSRYTGISIDRPFSADRCRQPAVSGASKVSGKCEAVSLRQTRSVCAEIMRKTKSQSEMTIRRKVILL